MIHLRNVTFMTTDPERLADFWAAVLDLPERRDAGDEVILADASWSFPRFTFQRVEGERPGPAPVHIDVTADDRRREVERLVALGATEGETHGDDDFRWTVMRDPDGNEFCLTDT